MSKIKILFICFFCVAGLALAAFLYPEIKRAVEKTHVLKNKTGTPAVSGDKTSGEILPASPEDFAALLKKAFASDNENEIKRLAGYLAGKDIDKALKLLALMKPDWKSMRAFISSCADKNPEAVAGWVISNLPKGGNRIFALRDALSKWTKNDPKAALTWAGKLPETDGRDYALHSVFNAWAKYDPASASTQLIMTDDFSGRDTAFSDIAYYWSLKDLNAATAWAWNLPEGKDKTSALSGIASMLYNSNDPAAAEWAKKLPGQNQDPVILGMAALLAGNHDINDTAALLSKKLPGGTQANAAFHIFLTQWMLKDPKSATSWASHLTDDRSREYAFSIIAQALALRDAESAASLLENIPEGRRKNDTIRQIASNWYKQNMDAAKKWADQLPDGDARNSAEEGIKQSQQPSSAPDTKGESPANSTPDEPTGPVSADPVTPEPPIEDLPDEVRVGMIHDKAFEMAVYDPLGAIAYLRSQLTPGPDLYYPLKAIMSAAVLTDLDFWPDWALQQANSADYDSITSGALLGLLNAGLAGEYPDKVARLIEALPEGTPRNNRITLTAYRTTHQAIANPSKWIDHLASEADKNFALSEVQRLSGQ